MKSKNKFLILLYLLFTSTFLYSQVEVEIQDMSYLTGGSISDCGIIDFENNEEITIQFSVLLTKPLNQAVGNGEIKFFTKKSLSDFENEKGTPIIVQSIAWAEEMNDEETFFTSAQVNLLALNFNTTAGIFFARYISSDDVEYNSCNYPIEKDEVPSFSLSPSSKSVSCGSGSPKTFTVTPSNTPSSASITYNWSVGSGWEDTNGNPVSNFPTTTTSVTLVPNAYPPSSVNVTPVLDGDSYPTLTSTVSLGDFNPVFEIIGDNYVCDTGVFTFDNMPSSVFIQSVSTSNPSIATASLDSNGEITVTKVSDGIVALSVVLQNSCNQLNTKTKELQIGIPSSVFNATITGSDDVCQGQNYTYTLNGANHPCVNNIIWNVTSNLNIVSQSANTITVSKNVFDNKYAGEISASIPESTVDVKKGVWIGTPSKAGLTIQKIGAYDFYVGRWTKLKTNYTPLTYESNSPLDVTFDWQIPNSMVRSFTDTAFKDVRPNSSGLLTIGVRAVCGCGNGEFRYRMFQVDGNTGGGGELTPIDGF